MIKLYYWPNSAIVMRVLWALEELEIPFEKTRLFQDKQEHRTPEYMAINPNGYMPALIEDGIVVFESLAIILYLAEKYGRAKKLWPEVSSPKFAEALSWSVWGNAALHPPLLEFARHCSDLHFALPKDQRIPQVAAQAEADSHRFLGILDTHLSGRQWMLGDEFSLVDVATATFIGRAILTKFDLSPYNNIRPWMGRCSQRPKFMHVMQENATAAKDGQGKAFEKNAVAESKGWDEVAKKAT
jgi:glutathione S-transferase